MQSAVSANRLPVEIEIETFAQLDEMLPAKPDIILLDNMPPDNDLAKPFAAETPLRWSVARSVRRRESPDGAEYRGDGCRSLHQRGGADAFVPRHSTLPWIMKHDARHGLLSPCCWVSKLITATNRAEPMMDDTIGKFTSPMSSVNKHGQVHFPRYPHADQVRR